MRRLVPHTEQYPYCRVDDFALVGDGKCGESKARVQGYVLQKPRKAVVHNGIPSSTLEMSSIVRIRSHQRENLTFTRVTIVSMKTRPGQFLTNSYCNSHPTIADDVSNKRKINSVLDQLRHLHELIVFVRCLVPGWRDMLPTPTALTLIIVFASCTFSLNRLHRLLQRRRLRLGRRRLLRVLLPGRRRRMRF